MISLRLNRPSALHLCPTLFQIPIESSTHDETVAYRVCVFLLRYTFDTRGHVAID